MGDIDKSESSTPLAIVEFADGTGSLLPRSVRFVRTRSRTAVWTGASRTGQALRD